MRSSSRYFEEMHAYNYYNEEIQKKEAELEKIKNKIRMIDEVLEYLTQE